MHLVIGAGTATAVPTRSRPIPADTVGASGGTRSPDRRADFGLCAAAAVLGLGLFWLVRGALIDDSYITLSYARNLATHLRWGLIPAEPANSATSPLNVLLLGGATALLRLGGGVHPVWGLAAVFVASAVALAWSWARLGTALRLPPVVPALGVALVLLNPFVLSATGLEVSLISALLIGLLAEAVRGRPVGFGIAAGLAVLTRLDLAIFVPLLALASPGVRRGWPRTLAAAAAVAGPWFVWSWWFFGSAIPDTFVIKTLQRSFGGWTFGNGVRLYYGRDALSTVLTFLPAVLGLAALPIAAVAAWRRRGGDAMPAIALGTGGAAYYASYVLLGVPPYQWYYVPSFVALSTALCVLIGLALRGGPLPRRAVALPGLAVIAAMVAGNVVADVRGGVPWDVPPIFGNWATAESYAEAGRGLRARVGAETVEAPPEIGTLAYFCECSIVDAFADRGRVVPLIEQRVDAAGPLTGPLLRLNYGRLDRDQRPRPARHRLVWEPGPATDAAQWQTWSPATGIGHLRLDELPAA